MDNREAQGAVHSVGGVNQLHTSCCNMLLGRELQGL